MQARVISTPIENPDHIPNSSSKKNIDTGFAITNIGVAIAEKQGKRPSQEDAVFYEMFDKDFFADLDPLDIAHRLWTALHCLDEDVEVGSTASVTIFDGKKTFITATIGDSTTFVALYGKDGKPLDVCRLHEVLHNVRNLEEEKRIVDCGGFFQGARVNGLLMITRALSDRRLQIGGVTADAKIDTWTLEQLCAAKGRKLEDVGKIQLIVACDGLTEGVADTKDAHEKHLLYKLKKLNPKGQLSEYQLASQLATDAIDHGSRDNVSVIAHTIKKEEMQPFVAGIFDGHGGDIVSTFAARWLSVHLKRLFSLDEKQYALEEKFSVQRNKSDYDKDNKVPEQKHNPLPAKSSKPASSKNTEEKPSLQISAGMADLITNLFAKENLSHIDTAEKQKILPLLDPKVGLTLKEFKLLSPEMSQLLLDYSDNIQRLVIDAKIPLSSLLKLQTTELQALFQHDYIVYGLRQARWSLETILPLLLDPNNTEKLQHASSYLHLVNHFAPPTLTDIFQNITGLDRKELFEHALEFGLMAKGIEEDKKVEFMKAWFRLPKTEREEKYKKVWAARLFLEKKYLRTKEIFKFDLPMLEELGTQNKWQIVKLIERYLVVLKQFAL